MTKLLWDQVTEKTYETGIDRGVLYLEDGSGVAWNGLTSVEQSPSSGRHDPLFFDGINYADHSSRDGYSATVKAYTYPDEFLPYQGVVEDSVTPGFYLTGQGTKRFGLSYRSFVGNDEDGTGYGYKLHLCYNLSATPGAVTYKSLSANTDPFEFTWVVTGLAEEVTNAYPTAYVIFDSRKTDPRLLGDLEDILYGTATEAPRLPTMIELLDIVGTWRLSDWWLSRNIVAYDERKPSGIGTGPTYNLGTLGWAANIQWTGTRRLEDDTNRCVYFPAVTGEYIQAQHTANQTVLSSWQSTVRVAFDEFQANNYLSGSESTHFTFGMDSAKKLFIQVLNTSLAAIGYGLSTSVIPGLDLNEKIWLRGKVTVATASCQYWYSFDNTMDENEVVWIPLSTVTGSNAGTTPLLTSSSVSTYGTNTSGLGTFKGRMYAGSDEVSGLVRHRWSGTSIMDGNATTISSIIGPPLTIWHSASAVYHCEVIWPGRPSRLLNGTSDYGEVPSDPLGAYVRLDGVNDYISTPDATDLDILGTEGTKYLSLPGRIGHYASIPNAAPLNITGDIEFVFRISADDWTPSTTNRFIAGKWNTAQCSWLLELTTGGNLRLNWSTTGSNGITATAAAASPFTDNTTYWVKITFDVDNGAGGSQARFYYAADQATEPSSWTQLTAPAAGGGATSIFAGTANVYIGGAQSLTPNFPGRFYRFIIRNGIGGTTVADVDFTLQTVGATSFTATAGGTCTVTGPLAKIIDGTTHGFLPGLAGAYYTSPSMPALQITDNIELVARHQGNWATGSGTLVGKWASGAADYVLYYTGGKFWYHDSNVYAAGIASATFALTDGTTYWVKVTHNTTTGAVSFYYAADAEFEPTSWTLITTTGASVGIRTISATQLSIGAYSASGVSVPATGRIYRVIIRNSANAVVFDADFTKHVVGATTFVEQSTNQATVTVNGGARIERFRDLEIVARVSADYWTPLAIAVIVSKWATSGIRSYMLRVGTAGNLDLTLSADGTNSTALGSSAVVNFPHDTDGWVKATYRASDRRVQFFKADDDANEPGAWTQVGTNLTHTLYSIYPSTAQMEIGSLDSGTLQRWIGRVKQVIVRNGIAGAIVANFQAKAIAANTSVVYDTAGKVWTLNGGCVVRDPNPLNFGPTDSFTMWALVEFCGTPTNYGRFMSKRELIDNAFVGLDLAAYGTTLTVLGAVDDGPDVREVITTATLPRTPVLLALVVDRTTQKLSVSIDDVVSATADITSVGAMGTPHPFTIGKTPNGGANQHARFFAEGVYPGVMTVADRMELKGSLMVGV